MAVVLDATAKVVALNAVGAYGRAQIEYIASGGTNVVAHVAPGRGGTVIGGIPAFDTVAEAVAGAAADAAIIYTPAFGVRDAIQECADAGIRLAAAAAEFVPIHDTLYSAAYARERNMWIAGPNTVGMVSPGKALLGAIPPAFTTPGRIGVIGRSGTLTMTVTRLLTKQGLGQSTVVHVGGDSISSRNPHEWLALFLDDPETDVVIYLGEIGGGKEYAMLEQISGARKPVVTMIVGRYAPAAKKMGHAGALVGGASETAAAKIAALGEAGAHIATSPLHVPRIIKELLQ